MDFHNLSLTITAIICLALGIIAIRNVKIPGAASLAVLSLFVIVWSGCYLLYENPAFNAMRSLWNTAAYLCATIAASAILTFALSHAKHSPMIDRRTVFLLTIMPLLAQIGFWVKPFKNVLFRYGNDPGTFLSFTGPWGQLNMAYIYTLSVISIFTLFETVFQQKIRPIPSRFIFIIVGATLPALALVMDWIGLMPLGQVHPVIFAFAVADLGICYGLFGQGVVELSPITREEVVEGMDDGWIVLDSNDTVVDINPAAEQMTGLPRENIFGQPIAFVLDGVSNMGEIVNGAQELEMKRSVKSEEGWRYINIRVASLVNQRHDRFGRLLLWHDITDRRLAEDARQRARDEMFVLLNAISSAASNTTDLDEFLLESIYHITQPFRSQVVGIFLLDEREKREEPRLFLASHFGLPAETVNGMAHVDISSPLFNEVIKNQQTLSIEDLSDPRIPPPMRDIGLSCLLVMPFVTLTGENSKAIGCICLARKEKPSYSQDEIVRLNAISDHIATLIDSDRRRKLSIASSERQRLLRDLHDSVSQKLYGLVTLTEAAQAGLEAGSVVEPAQVLSKIGENARQAVKEMRLFLYQMQPIDVEKDGLVSVLHHRLAAVEGRADIKARLLADENIALSKEKEIALYYIAQEALNNVLKHAHAKSISVTLKQGRQNVILEIVDDGYGFDVKKADRSGLGLQNMRERVSQINGKLKISSKPQEGTKIVITVRKDSHMKPSKRRR